MTRRRVSCWEIIWGLEGVSLKCTASSSMTRYKDTLKKNLFHYTCEVITGHDDVLMALIPLSQTLFPHPYARTLTNRSLAQATSWGPGRQYSDALDARSTCTLHLYRRGPKNGKAPASVCRCGDSSMHEEQRTTSKGVKHFFPVTNNEELPMSATSAVSAVSARISFFSTFLLLYVKLTSYVKVSLRSSYVKPHMLNLYLQFSEHGKYSFYSLFQSLFQS